MKKRFLELISKISDIESKFHVDPVPQGVCMPSAYEIKDVPEFQSWIQHIQLELQEIVDRTGDKFASGVLECSKLDYNGWSDKKYFTQLKNKLIAMSENIEKYYPEENTEDEAKAKRPKIFISHSSKDKSYVEKIVNLLESIGMDQTQFFCSSVPGYDIRLGKDICESLREQFLECDLHIVFVHSRNYYQSAVSLNEMGAAWALKSKYTSMLLPGFEFDEMVGVIDGRTIAIKLDKERMEVQDKLNQFYDQIVEEFHLQRKPAIVWEQKRDAFINEILDVFRNCGIQA